MIKSANYLTKSDKWGKKIQPNNVRNVAKTHLKTVNTESGCDLEYLTTQPVKASLFNEILWCCPDSGHRLTLIPLSFSLPHTHKQQQKHTQLVSVSSLCLQRSLCRQVSRDSEDFARITDKWLTYIRLVDVTLRYFLNFACSCRSFSKVTTHFFGKQSIVLYCVMQDRRMDRSLVPLQKFWDKIMTNAWI